MRLFQCHFFQLFINNFLSSTIFLHCWFVDYWLLLFISDWLLIARNDLKFDGITLNFIKRRVKIKNVDFMKLFRLKDDLSEPKDVPQNELHFIIKLLYYNINHQNTSFNFHVIIRNCFAYYFLLSLLILIKRISWPMVIAIYFKR